MTTDSGTEEGVSADDSWELPCAEPALREAAQVISDVHAQLALAYAYALTFRRAVRDYIPPDDQDILPCLSVGVLDVLDLQLPRLDTLLDHLTRCAAHIPSSRAGAAHRTHCVGAFPSAGAAHRNAQKPRRYSRRSRTADSADAAVGLADDVL